MAVKRSEDVFALCQNAVRDLLPGETGDEWVRLQRDEPRHATSMMPSAVCDPPRADCDCDGDDDDYEDGELSSMLTGEQQGRGMGYSTGSYEVEGPIQAAVSQAALAALHTTDLAFSAGAGFAAGVDTLGNILCDRYGIPRQEIEAVGAQLRRNADKFALEQMAKITKIEGVKQEAAAQQPVGPIFGSSPRAAATSGKGPTIAAVEVVG